MINAASAAVRRRRKFRGDAASNTAGVSLVGRGEEPPRHFEPGGFRLRLTDQASGAIAVDFLQLIFVNEKVAAADGALAAPERPQYDQSRRRGHRRKNKEQDHIVSTMSRIEKPRWTSPLSGRLVTSSRRQYGGNGSPGAAIARCCEATRGFATRSAGHARTGLRSAEPACTAISAALDKSPA